MTSKWSIALALSLASALAGSPIAHSNDPAQPAGHEMPNKPNLMVKKNKMRTAKLKRKAKHHRRAAEASAAKPSAETP